MLTFYFSFNEVATYFIWNSSARDISSPQLLIDYLCQCELMDIYFILGVITEYILLLESFQL